MTGKEFYALFAKRADITKAKAERYARALCDQLSDCFDELEPGERITFYGFGTFTKKETPSHMIGDLRTGGTKMIPTKSKIVFSRSET